MKAVILGFALCLLKGIGSHHMAQAADRLGPSAQPKAGSPAANKNLDDLKAKAIKGDVLAQFQLGVFYAGSDLINPPRGRGGRSRGGRGGNINWATIDWAKIDLKRALPKMYRDRIDANKDGKLSDEEILVFRRARALEARNKPRPNPLPTPQNYQEAAKWHRMAANQGHAQAQANLAILEAYGRGVKKDLGSAYAWISIAMANGLGSHQRLKGLKDVVANELSPELRLSGVQKELVKARAHANQMIGKKPNLLRVQIIRPPDDKASKPGTLIWKFAIGEESANRRVSISSPALGSDGALYFGADNGNVYSLKSDTGQIRWVFNTAEYSDLNTRGILARPTIGSDDTVYLAGERDVFALDGKTGEIKWKFGRDMRTTHPGFQFPPPGDFYKGSFIDSIPAIGPDGTVYLQANRHGASGIPELIALHPVTGKKKWGSGGHDFNFEAPVIGPDGTVYCGAGEDFFALNPKTGARKWTVSEHATRIRFRAVAAGNGGAVFVGSGSHKPEDSGAVFVMNGKTGERVGGFDAKGAVLGSPVLGRDGSIYFGARDKNVYAYDIKTGKNKWVFKTEGELRSSPAIGSDGTVYVGSEDKNFYALNGETGTKAWKLKTGHIVDSSPLIGPDGTIYIGSHDGNMYAITSNSKGPDRGPWPMFGGNAQRTGRAPKKE